MNACNLTADQAARIQALLSDAHEEITGIHTLAKQLAGGEDINTSSYLARLAQSAAMLAAQRVDTAMELMGATRIGGFVSAVVRL